MLLIDSINNELVNTLIVMHDYYIYSRFHIPSSTGSLIIAVKLKGDENSHMVAVLLRYILKKIPTLVKFAIISGLLFKWL
jgi:hypothetical protein